MNLAEEHLRMMAEGFRKLGHPQRIDEFVLEHGKPFDKVRSLGACGPMKECYSNSARALMRGNAYTYCEGYSVIKKFAFPFLHAWLVDDQGWAVETTLQHPHEHAYFGVMFKRSFVLSQMCKWEVYGILGGMPQQARELITDTDPSVWQVGAPGLDAVEEERAS